MCVVLLVIVMLLLLIVVPQLQTPAASAGILTAGANVATVISMASFETGLVTAVLCLATPAATFPALLPTHGAVTP